MDLSIYDVLDAATTKWNFLEFSPGLVGGHCIGVDHFYLSHKSIVNGHHPEIIINSQTKATGKWYLHDIFYNFDENIVTMGSALYDDKYQKIDGKWRIGFSEYDRILEEVSPINPETKFTKVLLSEKGDKIKK